MNIQIENFKNLHYETALLESLGWDNSQLESLYDYFDAVFNNEVIVNPEDILETVESFFGKDTKKCCEKIFNELIIANNLHIAENQNEH